MAAVLERLAELLPASLDAGLHAGQRNPDHVGGFLLREPLELGESQCLTIRRRKHRDERCDVTRKLALDGAIVVLVLRRLFFQNFPVCHAVLRGPALMVDDGGSRDLIDPSAEAFLVAKSGEAALHPQEDVLNDVVHVDLGVHAARDERTQLGLEVAPRSPRRTVDHAELSGEQQDGSQQDLPPGFTASTVADAT